MRMRAYNVKIIALHNGREVQFVEVVTFPLNPLDKTGCVTESVREAGAVEQVKIRWPELKDVRSNGSRHVSSNPNDPVEAEFRRGIIPFREPYNWPSRWKKKLLPNG